MRLYKTMVTLYSGCTMGRLRRIETEKTSARRWVRRRWELSSWTWKSALLTNILANNQSYTESAGQKMGLSFDGSCFNYRKGTELTELIEKITLMILGVPKSFHEVIYISHNLGIEWSVNINPYLDSYGHQLILFLGFVEQDEWGHQVLLLAINHVGFQSIQEFVVTQEYVAALFKYEFGKCSKWLGYFLNMYYNDGIPANLDFW